MKRLKSASPEETHALGLRIGASLTPGSILALQGDLGAGKTTLIKGIAHGFAQVNPRDISSPTFTYLNIYPGNIYHFDLYRLRSGEDFVAMGFEEHFDQEGLCLIEWPEVILDILPQKTVHIEINYTAEKHRELILSQNNPENDSWDF